MANFFYARTLPTPRVVSTSGGTWLSLGFPTASVALIPAEYVDGGGLGYLVQFQIQRTSTNATIRLNLDTNPSGSGGAALPEFINLFETRGLFRLTAGSVSRVFNLADATTGDTEEPYVWSWASAAVASEMRAVVDALRVDDPPSLELELAVPDGTITVRTTLGRPVGVRLRFGETQGLSVGASVGTPNATIHGEAEGVTVRATTGRPRGYKPSVAANGFTVEASQRQVAGFRRQFAYAEFLYLEPLGVRDRTRSGGSVWEWNNRDITPPYPVGDGTAITTVRVRSDQFRAVGSGNTLAGLGSDFIRHGDLILYSPAAGEFHIDPSAGRFDSAGRIRLSGDEWDAWWTAFSADATNELTVEWFFHGLEPVASVGRPVGEKDPTKYGEGLPVATALAVGRPRGYIPAVAAVPVAAGLATGRPHAFAHAEFAQADLSVGQPEARRFAPATGSQSLVPYVLDLGEPTAALSFVVVWSAGYETGPFSLSALQVFPGGEVRLHFPEDNQPPAAWLSSGQITLARQSGGTVTYSVADSQRLIFNDTLQIYNRSPAVLDWATASDDPVTVTFLSPGFVPYLASDAALGSPLALVRRAAIPIVAEHAVTKPLGVAGNILPLPIAAGLSVGRPRGLVKRAAQPIAMEAAVGEPDFLLFGKPGRWVPHDFPLSGSLNVGEPDHFNQTQRAAWEQSRDRSIGLRGPDLSVFEIDIGDVDPLGAELLIEASFPGIPRLRLTLSSDAAGTLVLPDIYDLTQARRTVTVPYNQWVADYLAAGDALTIQAEAWEAFEPYIALEHSQSRPHGFAHAEFILLEHAVGRPRGYIPAVAAMPIAQEQAVGRPAAILYGVPGSTTDGETVTESHNFGRYTLIRPDANSTWQFNANLTLPEPIMTASASPIVQAHVRANQVRFIRSGGQNPGFSDAFNARGRLTLTRVGAASFTITGPNFDHLGRMDPSGLDGYDAWWTAFRGGGTLSQLLVTWELEASGFQPFLRADMAVGMASGRTRRVADPMPLALLQAVGRPHAYAHAEFIQTDMAVGRPRGYLPSVAASGIAAALGTGNPHAYGHAVGIAAALAVSRPIAVVTRAVRPIAQVLALARPHAYAHAEFVLAELAAGRPRAEVTRATVPVAAALSVGQPHAYAHAEFVSAALTVGRPRAEGSRAALPVAAVLSTGRPLAQVKRAALPLAAQLGLGQPAADSKEAARAIAAELAVGQPRAEGSRAALPVAQVLSTGRPRGHLESVAALPLAAQLGLGRPHAYAHAEFIQTDLAVGRPRGYLRSVAAMGIALDAALGQPNGQRLTYAEPFPASLLWQLGARNRTRSGGRTWEWNDDDLTLPPPFGTHADNEKDRTRISATMVRITDPDNNSLGFTTRLASTGSMTLWSPSDPAIPRIRFDGPVFSPNGTYDPTGHAGWVDWWAAFSADTTHELSILWEIPGIEIDYNVGRPLGVTDLTRYGLPESIALTVAVGRPYAYAHAEFVQSDLSLLRPRGYLPSVAAAGTASENTVGRPHAFAHAEFVQSDLSLSRPRGYIPAVAGTAIAAAFSSGRPVARVKRAVQPIAATLAVGMADGELRRVANGLPIAAALALGRPRGYSESVAALPIASTLEAGRPVALVRRAGRPLTAALAIGRPHAYAHTAAIALAVSAGRPRGYIPAVAGTTISAHYALGRPHAYAHAEFVQSDLSLSRPRGYIPAVAAVAIATELMAGRPHAYAHAEFVQSDLAVGRPVAGVDSRATLPIAAALALGRPHAYAHAEFVQSDLSLGRPIARVKRAALAIAESLALGMPIGVRRRISTARPIAAALVASRPVSLVTRAARPIAAALAVGMAFGERPREGRALGTTAAFAVSRPYPYPVLRRAALECAVVRPAAVLNGAARPIVAVLARSRPRGYLPSVAAVSRVAAMRLGMPIGERLRISSARGVAFVRAVGRPFGLIQAVASGVAFYRTVGRPDRYYPRRRTRRVPDAVTVAPATSTATVRAAVTRVSVIK